MSELRKPYLLGAGPMALHPEVALALSRPMLHHTSLAFNRIYGETVERLGQVFQTRNDIAILPCSGTGAVEAMLVNALKPGEKILVCSCGFYGERMQKILAAYGIRYVALTYPPGTPASAADVEKALDENRDVTAVAMVHVETSAGVITPIAEIAAAARKKKPDILVLVDAVASMGGARVETDAWQLDMAVTASQKALMGAPGLGIVSVSNAAWKKIDAGGSPHFYFDLRNNRDFAKTGLHAVTPAVSLIVGLHKALEMILEEGLDSVYARHLALRDYVLAALKAENFAPLAKPGAEAPTVTAILAPEGVSTTKLVDTLEHRQNVKICSGLGEIQDRCLRIGHMGYVDLNDVKVAIATLKEVMEK